MTERKQTVSFTADSQTMRLLTAMAEADARNRSETFRLMVRETAVKRGLLPLTAAPAAVQQKG